MTKNRIYFLLAAFLMAFHLFVVLILTPRERIMGDVQKVFYFHLPLAWTGFLAFGVGLVASILYLKKRNSLHDLLTFCSIEIGIIFTTLTLISGALWAKISWGTYWVWEPRLTTTFILWLMYVFYLILRRSIEEREKKRIVTSVYSIFCFLNVPIVFLSIRIWRSLHPVVFHFERVNISGKLLPGIFTGIFAFVFLYLFLLEERIQIEKMKEELHSLRERIGGRI